MLIPPESLIDGAMRTLREQVLPDVETSFARGQLYAVIDVLNNLRDRIEVKAAIHDADAGAARQSLDGALEAITAAGAEALAADVRAALPAPDAEAAARAEALRHALRILLERRSEVPADAAESVDAAVRGYLVGQAIRDIAHLKPSMLSEISKG